jgi:transcription initiation factor TFIIIB Brf1 subunit/transcription initiation factor TFIIB
MKCPYCKTKQIRTDDPEQGYTYITCECPGNVIVEVWFDEKELKA